MNEILMTVFISWSIPILSFIIFALIYFGDIFGYKKTQYYKITHTPYFKMRFDTGLYGEYLTYKYLKHLENSGGKFLFNVYIPRKDSTTEVDLILLHKTGLYVFESKNYSGWIFGKDTDRNWTQSLPRGRKSIKEKFLNPIFQNNTHIKYLKEFLSDDITCYSIIVFSERCTFKNVTVSESNSIKVIQRFNVKNTIEKLIAENNETLTDEDLSTIYDKLYPCTQVTDAVKLNHIQDINERLNNPEKEEKPEPMEKPEPTPADDNICPKCGGTLTLRTAKKGKNEGQQFYGCSNYPKCRYIVQQPTKEN